MTTQGIATDGKPYSVSQADCQHCGRMGFPVLPVRPSVVDRRHAAALNQASADYVKTLDSAFATLPRHGTTPVTRLLRKGYVYVYYQARDKWDVWRSHDNGTFLKLLELATPEQYGRSSAALTQGQAESVCARGAANVPTGLITVLGPDTQPDIWIAYARHAWHPDVLARYGSNQHGARGDRMTHINGQALLKQGTLPPMSRALTRTSLEILIPEYSPFISVARAPSDPLVRAFKRSEAELSPARFGCAADLADAARKMETAAGPDAVGKGLIVMLRDPVGVASDYNDIRLSINEERQAWMGGGPDATGANQDRERPWKRQSMVCAAAIREALRKKAREHAQSLSDAGVLKSSITISEQDYLRVRREEAQGKQVYPPGTQYERLATRPVVYRVTWSQQTINRGLDGVAVASTTSRIERYNRQLRWDVVESTNRTWLAQEKGWNDLQAARDKDYVAWLESETMRVALRHDFADRIVLGQAVKNAATLRADLDNAMARVEAVARCYGGGVCGMASLRHMATLFGKEESDPTHWFARALIQPFSLLGSIAQDPGAQASLYDALVGTRAAAIEQLREGWTSFASQDVPHLSSLLLVSTAVTNQMRRLALSPDLAKQVGLSSQLSFAQAKQGIWVRTAALLDFVQSGRRRYLVGIMAEQNLDHASASGRPTAPATIARIEADPASPGGRKTDRANTRRQGAKSHLNALGLSALGQETVFLVFDDQELQHMQRRAGGAAMVTVASHDLFGKPTITRIPADMAEGLLRDPVESFKGRFSAALGRNFQTHFQLPSLAAVTVFALQSRALWKSLDDVKDARGLQRMEALAGIMSAALGITGAVTELAVLGMAGRAAASTSMPAATVAGRIPATTGLRLFGGFLAGGASVVDGVGAYFKLIRVGATGDRDAANALTAQTFFQVTGGMGVLGGYALQWVVARRVATGAAARAGIALASGTFLATGTIAAWVSGIGLALSIVGFGAAIAALILLDDPSEVWLNRSYFGRHDRTEGKFAGIAQEMDAFGALARGVSVDWHESWGGSSVNATIVVPSPEGALTATYRVLGYASPTSDTEPVETLTSGQVTHAAGTDGKTWKIDIEGKIASTQTKAVRLYFEIVQDGAPIAKDALWIKK